MSQKVEARVGTADDFYVNSNTLNGSFVFFVMTIRMHVRLSLCLYVQPSWHVAKYCTVPGGARSLRQSLFRCSQKKGSHDFLFAMASYCFDVSRPAIPLRRSSPNACGSAPPHHAWLQSRSPGARCSCSATMELLFSDNGLLVF